MNSRQPASRVAAEQHNDESRISSPHSEDVGSLGGPVRCAIGRTRQWLLEQQFSDGSWCAELQGDTILESETILLLAFLGREDTQLAELAAAYLVDQQLADGGWAMYPGGPNGNQRKRKGLLRLKAHRPRSRRRIHATCPGGHPQPRRGRCRQQLHTILLGPAGPDFLRAMSGRAAGDHALAEMVSGESLRGQCLVANDDCAFVDHFCDAAGAAHGTAPRHPRAVLAGAEALAGDALPGPLRRFRPAQLEPPLPHDRRGVEVVSETPPVAAATQSLRRRRTVDDRAIRRQRRPRRHLSADGVGSHGPKCWAIPTTVPKSTIAENDCKSWCSRMNRPARSRIQPCKSPIWDTALTVRAP